MALVNPTPAPVAAAKIIRNIVTAVVAFNINYPTIMTSMLSRCTTDGRDYNETTQKIRTKIKTDITTTIISAIIPITCFVVE